MTAAAVREIQERLEAATGGGTAEFLVFLRHVRTDIATLLSLVEEQERALRDMREALGVQRSNARVLSGMWSSAEEQVNALTEGLRTIRRLTDPGTRTFDELMRDTGLANDVARGLLNEDGRAASLLSGKGE